MGISGRIISFRSIYHSNNPIGIFGIIAIILSVVSIMALTVYSELYIYVLPVLIALPLVFLIFVSPKIWLNLLVLTLLLFFHAGDEGVGTIDVLLGLFYLGSLALWFIWKVMILRQKVVLNWGDWAILAFYGILLLNFFVAVFNEVDPMNWLREYLLISIILIYFPVRDTLKTEKDITDFLLVLGFVIVGAGTYQAYEYYQKVNNNLVYAYELKSSITVNQTLYTAAAMFGFILAFSQKNKLKEIFVIMLTSLYVVFLISTFSRTFWLILGASIFLMFFFLPAGKKVLFLTYLGVISFVLMIAAFLFMRDQADIALGVVFSRFESTSEGRKDPSLIARFKEWEKLEYHIKQNPLGGNGLAKTFTFHFPINSRARHTNIIHNGYLWLAYRVGIPMGLLFMFFIGFYTIRAGVLLLKSKSQLTRAILVASLAVLLSMYIINITSAQYFTRDGIFVTAFTIALIGIAEKLGKQNPDSVGVLNGKS